MRLSEEEYHNLIRRVACPQKAPIISLPGPASRSKPSKYHNIITECDNIKFQSKKEAAYYRELCCRVHSGEVLYFLRQTVFHLAGGVKYLVDFAEFWADGTVHFVDVKGHKTAMYKVKKRLVEAEYPIKIEEA